MSNACMVLFGFILLYNSVWAYGNSVSFTQGQSGSGCSAGKWLRWDSVKSTSPHSVIYPQNCSNTLHFINWHKHPFSLPRRSFRKIVGVQVAAQEISRFKAGVEVGELHFCLSTSVSLSPVAIRAVLRIFLVEVFKHSLCSLCAEHVMMLSSAGFKTLSPATDLCMRWGHSQYFWMFGSKVWSDLLQNVFFKLPDVQKS